MKIQSVNSCEIMIEDAGRWMAHYRQIVADLDTEIAELQEHRLSALRVYAKAEALKEAAERGKVGEPEDTVLFEEGKATQKGQV